MHKKINWNKRMKGSESSKKKVRVPFLIQKFRVEEVLDESGEVSQDTIILISFDGLLIHMSIANALKLNKELNDVLLFKE